MDTGQSNTAYNRLPEETGQRQPMQQQQPVPPPSYEQYQMDPNFQQGPPPPQPVLQAPPQPQSQQPQYTSTNNTTVVVAPTSPTMIQVQHVLDDHMRFAIFTTICCFWPVGIFAILKARDVHKKAYQGDMTGSMQASRSAHMLSLCALGIGLGSVILSIIVIFVAIS